jgi:MinD-like ATPase involved in chromosome partitioning or flagellar assembly
MPVTRSHDRPAGSSTRRRGAGPDTPLPRPCRALPLHAAVGALTDTGAPGGPQHVTDRGWASGTPPHGASPAGAATQQPWPEGAPLVASYDSPPREPHSRAGPGHGAAAAGRDAPYPEAYPARPYPHSAHPAAPPQAAYQHSMHPARPAAPADSGPATERGSRRGSAPAAQGGATGIAGGPAERAATLGLGRGSRERELVRRVTVPVRGGRRVMVASIKGGVGKTTTVAVVGSLLAGLRRDRVVALDASSDWGTLAARLSVVPRQSVRDLAARGRHAVSEQGMLAQLVSSPSGLLVVGSDPQSVVSRALTEEEYRHAMHLLGYVASVVLVDVGAGLQQPFLAAALSDCDQLVVATAATWDATQSAAAALDWLAARGRSDLVRRSIVVMTNLHQPRRRRRGFVDELRSDLHRRSRAVRDVPFDPALQPGGRILLRKLASPTRQAYLQVAADIMSGVGAS